MQTRIIQTAEEFVALQPAWNRLVASLDRMEPFDLWEWAYTAFTTCLHDSSQLFIVVLEEGKELKAIAPLCIQPVGAGPFRGRALRMIAGDHADYGSFLLHPEHNHHLLLKQILETLFENRDRWDVLHLLNFSSRNPQSLLLDEIAKSEFDAQCFLGEQVLTPYFRFRENGGKIVAKEARNLRRREKNLHRDHDVEITVGGEFDDEFWQAFLRFHLSKWPDSIFRDERNRRFFEKLLPLLQEKGMAELSRLEIDGKIAALHLGFRTAKKICYYIPVYDPAFAREGVGGILLKHIIDEYAGKKEEFDFLRGNEPYKFYWTDLVAANHNLLIDNGRFKGRAIRRFIQLKDRLRRVTWLKRLADMLKRRPSRPAPAAPAPLPQNDELPEPARRESSLAG